MSEPKFLTSVLLGMPVFLRTPENHPVLPNWVNNERSCESRSKPDRFSSLGGMVKSSFFALMSFSPEGV